MSDALYETLVYTVSDAVATISLNRPDRMNAMNRTMRAELTDAFARAAEEARVMLLTAQKPQDPSAKAAFCAGQDLGDIRNEDLEQVLREEYGPMLRGLIDAPIPSIAAIGGSAAGAGLHLALSADLVFAARSATLTAPFARIGLIPGGAGSFWLPRLAGPQRAAGMALLGEPVDAETAERWGLVWRCVDDAALDAAARAAAERLAKGPTEAYRLTRIALRRSLGNDLDAQLELEARLQGDAGRTRDFAEGVAAFLEKRRPHFEGR